MATMRIPACDSAEDTGVETDRCTRHSNQRRAVQQMAVPKAGVGIGDDEKAIDTGDARSLISEETYHKVWARNAPPQLSREPLDLRTWSGEELRVLGIAHMRVKFKADDCVLPLLLMKGAGCNLLGRDWLAPLHIQVHGINQMEHPADEIKEVIYDTQTCSEGILTATQAP
ncbi:hypothetical protein MTO96_007172 [Rhipicephalus appendiculatus]